MMILIINNLYKMNKNFLLLILPVLFTTLLFFSCRKNLYYGTHCALVTIDDKEYTLEVEVEDNYVTAINFPNGGWLDSDHFDADEAYIDSNTASFYDDRDRYIEIDFDGCTTDDFNY
jgi:hypothetical protein